ncbi:hypothetical protein BZY95_19305 [Billgrantia desiderata SP1]|uniref:hypothetical protein n=1 Tax=Billgrantia desiderata TaxID=52021 RepID=UPI000A3BE6BD|nr:hypothetical protein [Halomonas desiderata]OUE38058.1 hypothetical protein BZY95_19305 [Halomonas desiderata SP1]
MMRIGKLQGHTALGGNIMNLGNIATWFKQVRYRSANHRHHVALKECDARMLRDIGLYRERGRLMPLHPEREEQ